MYLGKYANPMDPVCEGSQKLELELLREVGESCVT